MLGRFSGMAIGKYLKKLRGLEILRGNESQNRLWRLCILFTGYFSSDDLRLRWIGERGLRAAKSSCGVEQTGS